MIIIYCYIRLCQVKTNPSQPTTHCVQPDNMFVSHVDRSATAPQILSQNKINLPSPRLHARCQSSLFNKQQAKDVSLLPACY